MNRPDDISPLARLMRRVEGAAPDPGFTDSLATSFPSIDAALGGGLRRGDFVLLGGETGSGKSSLALAMALRMAAAGLQVTFQSQEMTVERLLERALAIDGRCRVDDLRGDTLTEAARVGVAAAALRLRERSPRLETMITGGTEPLAHALRSEAGLQVAFVDPVQALATGGAQREEDMAGVALTLKRLALDLDIALVATAQTTHVPSAKNDRRPVLDDFGAMGALRQHADVVLGLYREEMFHPGSGVDGATELLLLKNRNGRPGYVDLYFYEHCLRFEDLLDR